MMLAFALALQSAAPAGQPPVPPIRFDLGDLQPPAGDLRVLPQCRGSEGSEIVVCGRRRRDDGEFVKLERRFGRSEPLRAEIGLGGGVTGNVNLQQAEMPGGQVSKRIMVGVKVPF